MMTAFGSHSRLPIWQPVNLILARGVVPVCPNSTGLADVDHGPMLWVREGAAEHLMGNGRDVALTQYEKAQ